MLTTRDGDIPVEWIAAGDEVLTRDHSFQPIRWVGRFPVSSLHMAMRKELGAFVVERDAFGRGCPDHPLTLSRDLRILIGGNAVQLHFGTTEALCPTIGLFDEARVSALADQNISYTQVLCEQHELIMANGLWVETLLLDEATFYGPSLPPAHFYHETAARLCLNEDEGQMLTRLNAVEQPALHGTRVA